MPFIEALRQFQFRVGRENMCFMHVSLVPVIGVVGEEKTKPTQHSVQQLRAVGLTPDFLVCRSGQARRRRPLARTHTLTHADTRQYTPTRANTRQHTPANAATRQPTPTYTDARQQH
eukprot:950900-Pleurochrysis_carterae.AAC.9